MTEAEQAAAVRRGAGLFRLEDRGLVSVGGDDRRRWLDGMISNDVAALEPGPERSGCYALLLSRTGRIVADLHVLLRGDSYWLETERAFAAPLIATLDRFVIADDVRLADRSAEFARLAIEGPAAADVLVAAAGQSVTLAPEACAELEIGGVACLAAAFGWSGEAAYQIFAPRLSADAVAAALCTAGADRGLVEATAGALEVLRIEAGVPRLGAELDEEVLPPEARLERAISTTKGCYTGQEVVARLASRGRVKHLLVGLRCEGDALPPAGAQVEHAGEKIGDVTSACHSPAAGAIALAYVRRPHDEPGTRVVAGDCAARVAALPFVSSARSGA